MTDSLTIEGKALNTAELQNGDLILEGHCVVWDSLDLAGEGFLRGALDEAIPQFLDGGRGTLAWQHQPSKFPLGRVLDMKATDDGVWFRARVDRQQPGSSMFEKYEAIRRGSARGVSVAGHWTKAFVPGVGTMIDKVMRLTEVSITPVAMDGQTKVFATEVKAAMNPQPLGAGDVISRLLLLRRAAANTLAKLDRQQRPATLAEVKADVQTLTAAVAQMRTENDEIAAVAGRRREAQHAARIRAWTWPVYD
jgi:HK97 family phage prohead protease